MSTSSTRRPKDPTLSLSSALRPSPSHKFPTTTTTTNAPPKLSTEKENRRSTSRGSATASSHRPSLRPIPPTDKSSIVNRDRKSTSSVPRGRSSSPSDFTRVFSETKKDRRVSVDRVVRGKGYTRDFSSKGKSRESIDQSGRKSFNSEIKSRNVRLVENKALDSEKVKPFVKSSTGNDVNLCFDEVVGESGVKAKVLEIPKEKEIGVSCKYPSRLHEKLAFLEGKVKRIASDIRRTKEMLDLNNPDQSKIILSDIQDKISGIEKAIDHVASDSGSKIGLLKGNGSDVKEPDVVVDSQDKKVDNGKRGAKELSSEELEARLFPHRKLLQNRTLDKASLENCMSNESVEKQDVEEKAQNTVEEIKIAQEFLANLDKEAGGEADVKYCGVNEPGSSATAKSKDSSALNEKCDVELILTSDEKLEEFDDQENRQGPYIDEEADDNFIYSLNEIGNKTAVGGWFVSEGEAVLIAHDDGSCSYYDVANREEKALYMPPSGVSPNMWRDCWIIRAPGSDGCSGRFVVAASAGNTMDSGFCSWDFYTKDIRAFQLGFGTATSRTALRPLPNNIGQRNSGSASLATETSQWWYRPCGPLIISTASSQKTVKVFDIRDGEQVMKWEVQKPVLTMDYSSPLQWRNRGKVVIAEAEAISLWDVNSLSPQALLSIPSSGQKISALNVCNTDAELGGGVRQRVSSSEAEGSDGVFCTSDAINILDFRQQSGVGLRIPKQGVNAQSVFSRGDSIFLGCSTSSSYGKKQSSSSMVQQFSLRKQGLFTSYALPESNAHPHHSAITQVWGNSNFVMAVCGLGLFVFDALKDDPMRAFNMDPTNTQGLSQVIGPDDLYWPSFDYLSSRALLISRDRPAMWKQLS